MKQNNPTNKQTTKKRKLDTTLPPYYSYKQTTYNCKHCKWNGLGSLTEMGDIGCDWNFFELLCPKCHELLGTVLFPTHDEVKLYGTEEEKKESNKREEFINEVNESRLKTVDQLVDIIDDDHIIINWDYDGKDNLIKYKNVILWREKATYESYERYLEVARILREKYRGRLQDFIPTPRSELYLYGDSLNSFQHVMYFRNLLKKL